jgi:hypothetical protein
MLRTCEAGVRIAVSVQRERERRETRLTLTLLARCPLRSFSTIRTGMPFLSNVRAAVKLGDKVHFSKYAGTEIEPS